MYGNVSFFPCYSFFALFPFYFFIFHGRGKKFILNFNDFLLSLLLHYKL